MPSSPIEEHIAKHGEEQRIAAEAKAAEALEAQGPDGDPDGVDRAFDSAKAERVAPLMPLAPASETVDSFLEPVDDERAADLRAAEAIAEAALEEMVDEVIAHGDEPDDVAEASRDLSGRRVVLVLDTEYSATGWGVVVNPTSQQGVAEPLLYEGTRDEAIRAALDDDRNVTLADAIRTDPSRYLLVSVPASSWAPAPVKPKVTKTTWIVQR